MEEISVKGENYIKAGTIAEQFGYTADYVGQLCRSKQVKATLVGRSWYVSEKSLREHKKGRYRSSLAKSKESVRKMTEERSQFPNSRFMERLAHYEADEGDLMPVLAKGSEKPKAIEMTVYSRENIEIKPDLEPKNKVNIHLAEKKVTKPQVVARKPLPSVRIISARANSATFRQNQTNLATQKGSRNRLAAALASLTALVLAGGISIAAVGLEKRIVVAENDGEFILYNFDLEPVKKMVTSRL